MKVEALHREVVGERLRVRRLWAGLPRSVAVPEELKRYENSLCTLEVLLSDLSCLVLFKNSVTDEDIRLNPASARALGFKGSVDSDIDSD
jgi:hypothetical protein